MVERLNSEFHKRSLANNMTAPVLVQMAPWYSISLSDQVPRLPGRTPKKRRDPSACSQSQTGLICEKGIGSKSCSGIISEVAVRTQTKKIERREKEEIESERGKEKQCVKNQESSKSLDLDKIIL